jgi:hypothetical protein
MQMAATAKINAAYGFDHLIVRRKVEGKRAGVGAEHDVIEANGAAQAKAHGQLGLGIGGCGVLPE